MILDYRRALHHDALGAQTIAYGAVDEIASVGPNRNRSLGRQGVVMERRRNDDCVREYQLFV